MTCTSLGLIGVEQNDTKQDKGDQDKKIDRLSLLKCEQLLACNGFKVSGKEQANNPFLACPLECGERKVALVSRLARFEEKDVAQHVSSLWTFAPVIPCFRRCDLHTYDGWIEAAAERRSRVRLSFRMGKKSSATVNKHRKVKYAESISWFANDASMDDHEMTEEKFVKDSFANGKRTYLNDAVVN